MRVKIEKISDIEVNKEDIVSWPVWEKEISRFDWKYEGTEQCYILEGEVIVETKEGVYHIKGGDFVTFPDGLECVWDIKSAIRKHYNFI